MTSDTMKTMIICILAATASGQVWSEARLEKRLQQERAAYQAEHAKVMERESEIKNLKRELADQVGSHLMYQDFVECENSFSKQYARDILTDIKQSFASTPKAKVPDTTDYLHAHQDCLRQRQQARRNELKTKGLIN